MAHIGLTPQSVRQFGGFKVQRDGERLKADALAIEAAGAFSVVVECVPTDLAAEITALLRIPTIGIGAARSATGKCSSAPTCSVSSTTCGRNSQNGSANWARLRSKRPSRIAATFATARSRGRSIRFDKRRE